MKKQIQTFMIGALMASAVPGALAKGSKAPRDSYEASLEYLAQRGGVSTSRMSDFYQQTQRVSGSGHADPTPCFAKLEDSNKRREEFLACLQSYGSSLWGQPMGLHLIAAQQARVHMRRSTQVEITVALLGYLSDLNREGMRARGQTASWIAPGKGFLPINNHYDFEFEDGDVVLGLGNSSLSAVISQFNEVPSRYSHAFIVRKRKGVKTTLESLVQTGVKEFKWDHFVKDPYNQFTVLRWKNKSERATIATRASDYAAAVAAAQVPYDFSMDLKSDNAIYCSELVIKAFSHAAQLNISKIIHTQSQVKNDAIHAYGTRMGVTQKKFVSPGDLLNSDKFEIVAEYRRQENLLRAWELYLFGDYFLDEISRGATVTPDPLFVGVPITMWITQLLPSMFHRDARLIPKNISPQMLSILATQEMKIMKPSLAKVKRDENGKRSLLDVPLWNVRTSIAQAFKENPWIRTSIH